MGDIEHKPGSVNLGMQNNLSKKLSKQCRVATGPQSLPQRTLNRLVSLKHAGTQGLSSEKIVLFLLKVAALEMVRRVSRARYPIIWQSLQALQILCYTPLKWLRKWPLLKILVKGMQKLSRPLLVLSITTAFSDQMDLSKRESDSTDGAQPYSESSNGSENADTRISTKSLERLPSENWLIKLYKELENQGITIPERITEDDLQRFYVAANGDFSSLILSVKRTIRWRETFRLLPLEELAEWSHLVFWHGCDLKLRPCLIIRLGLACSCLKSDDRPRFAQAIVSQLEHGVLHLVNLEDRRVTVLMDCEGVSAMRFPMQILRSFSSLVQDHYPNRLALLFIVRLPPVVRVIAQTFIQVLKPATREKLLIVGEMYHKFLADHLQTIPVFLEGACECPKCMKLDLGTSHTSTEKIVSELMTNLENHCEPDAEDFCQMDPPFHASCNQVLRTSIIGVLMFWILIALILVLQDVDSSSTSF